VKNEIDVDMVADKAGELDALEQTATKNLS